MHSPSSTRKLPVVGRAELSAAVLERHSVREPHCVRWFPFVIVLLLAAANASCRGDDAPAPKVASADARPASPPPLPAAPNLSDAVKPPPPSALWLEAKSGQTGALVRLGRRQGAAALLEGLEQGGWVARSALGALPFAPDGEFALGRLCEIAVVAPAAQAGTVLTSLHALVAEPLGPNERTAVDSARRCHELAPRLVARTDLGPAEADLAKSVVALLGARRNSTAAPSSVAVPDGSGPEAGGATP